MYHIHNPKCVFPWHASWTLAPLMPPRFWGWTKRLVWYKIFSSSNYLLMAFHLASSPREQTCRQKNFWFDDWRQGPQFDEWKTESLSGLWCSTPKPAAPLLVIRNRKWLSYYILSFNLLIMGNQPISLVIYHTRKEHPPTLNKKKKKPWTSDMAGPDFFSSWKMASGFLCWALAKVVIFQHL